MSIIHLRHPIELDNGHESVCSRSDFTGVVITAAPPQSHTHTHTHSTANQCTVNSKNRTLFKICARLLSLTRHRNFPFASFFAHTHTHAHRNTRHARVRDHNRNSFSSCTRHVRKNARLFHLTYSLTPSHLRWHCRLIAIQINRTCPPSCCFPVSPPPPPTVPPQKRSRVKYGAFSRHFISDTLTHCMCAEWRLLGFRDHALCTVHHHTTCGKQSIMVRVTIMFLL